MTGLIAWMDQVAPASALAVAGPKMGRLAELGQSGVRVPCSFAVTVDAFRAHSEEHGLARKADDILSGVDTADGAAVEGAALQVQAVFRQAPLSDALRRGIVEAYDELSDRCVDLNAPVAVRSSATGEDSGAASFAGAFDTYLGVSGADRVVEAVRGCWASLFTPRATAYRLQQGIDHRDMPMAVGVVELVHARSSGVAFSTHPVTGKRDRVVLEANWGWGEAVVQGLVTPDHVEVGKTDRRVLRYDVASKQVVSAFDYAVGAVTEVPMPARLRDRQVLDDDEVAQIVDAVLRIEEHYGHPVDVEWVVDRHRRAGEPVSIVQTRPVTVVAETEPPKVWDPAGFAAKYAFGGRR
jgi:pyruvate,water dikinase